MPRIALCQFIASEDPTTNLEHVREHVSQARARGATVAVFPEATMARFGTRLAPLAEPLDGPWATALASLAEEAGMLLIAGMFTPADGGRVYNTLLITGHGQHTGYRKIHLYDAFGFTESRTVAGGDTPVTVDVDAVDVDAGRDTFRLGFATCYDVRFPELFRSLADAGAAGVVVPASWGAGEGKRDQWELLVRARALDAGCWVLACGQADPAVSGVEVNPKAPTGIGYSTVADPFGRIHAQLGAGPDMLVVDVDAETAERSQQATAVLPNRVLSR